MIPKTVRITIDFKIDAKEYNHLNTFSDYMHVMFGGGVWLLKLLCDASSMYGYTIKSGKFTNFEEKMYTL